MVVPGQFEDAECSDDGDDNDCGNITKIGQRPPFGGGIIKDQQQHDSDECLPNNDDDDDKYLWYNESGDTKLSKSFPKKKTTPLRTVPPSATVVSSSTSTTIPMPQKPVVTKPHSSSLPSSQQLHHHYNEDYDDHFDDDDDDDDFKTTFRTPAAAAAMSNISHKVQNRVQQLQHLEYSKRTLHTDKNDRATSEQVLDPRTRYILFKLLQSNQLREFHGCISTGKEANVYYATAAAAAVATTGTVDNQSMDTTKQPPQPPTNESTNDNGNNGSRNITEYAVKIYKTSILVFKDRDKYVSGEYRYRNGYCKSNPRKMISVWAEKEIRNYKRIYFNSTIPCPQPILIKQHVLVMEFLGHDGWPSPRLKDVVFSDELRNTKYYAIYIQCLHILRQLVQQCKLIHGDYSEYNLLYHHQTIYVIDVSQSVELNHPMAMDLLKQDITNITDYFKKLFYKTNYTTMTTPPVAGHDSNETSLPTPAAAAVSDASPDATNNVDEFYLLSPMEAFDFIMAECRNSNNTNSNDIDVKSNQKKIDEHDKELLHKLLEEGKQRRREQQQQQRHEEEPADQQQQRYEMMMKERMFLNSYIPRTLNEITVTEKDYYATLNHSSSSSNNKSSNTKTNKSNTTSIEAQAIAAMTIHNTNNDVTTSRAVPLSSGDKHDPPESARDNDQNSTSDKDSDDDDDSSSTSSSNDVQYERVNRTVEELEQERLIRKEERRSNKKLVREQQSLKRQNKKMKKKDKKRAITKTKSKT